MRLLYKSRGAVSIFLIIILLPTLTIAGIFVDLARTKLASEVAISSADLALNTVLTDYDKELKDYFGLLASCQDTSSIINVSKQYFADSMVSAGFQTADALAYADNVFTAFAGDSDIRDMLQISVVDNSTKIEKMDNGALDNPALLKNGIIEFMKYRAPVNAAADLFSKLNDPEVQTQMENLSKETQMIEARDAFYKAERELIEQAETAYNAIKEYQNYRTRHVGSQGGNIISEDTYLESMSRFLAAPAGEGKGSFPEVYKNAHTTLVMNLYNTHDPSGLNQVTLLYSRNIAWQNISTKYSDSNKAKASEIEKLLKNMNDAYVTYVSRREKLDAAWSNVGSKSSSDWGIQYWVRITKNCKTEYDNYVTAAQNLWACANKVDNAVENAEEKAMEKRMSRLSNRYVTYATPDELGTVSLQQTYNALWNSYVNNYKSEIENRTGCRSYRNINSAISSVNTTENNNLLKVTQLNPIFTIRNWINKYILDAKDAANLAKDAADKTRKLLDLIDKYRKAFDTWEEIAFDSELDDSSVATMEDGDRDQITRYRESGLDFISKNSVKDLRQRLTNIQVLWQTIEKDLRAIKYKSTAVLNITEYKDFRSASNLSESRIVVNESALRQYAEESFSFTIGTEIQRIEIPLYYESSGALKNGDSYRITYSFHPNVEYTPRDMPERARLDLYYWMKEKFDGPTNPNAGVTAQEAGMSVQSKSEAKDADKTVDKQSTDTSEVKEDETTTGRNFSDWDGATLPSAGDFRTDPQTLSAKISDVSSYAQSLFSDFSGTFGRSLVNARDDLYTISYVFGMFTWDTFEKEGCYELLSETEQQSKHPEEYYESKKEIWKQDEDTLVPRYKTLTLTPRDGKNNYAYGSEIEYILYGHGDNVQNKNAAYSRIYMIRYALDLGPVFKYYWDDKMLCALAAAIEAFIHVPQGVTKTVACLAITAAEAAVDVNLLKTGQPVLLYKSDKQDLICNYKSVFAGASKTNGSRIKDRVALQYSDYLKVFLLMGLIGKDENRIYLRIGDVIQANMAISTGQTGKDGFSLAKSQVFYTLTSTVRIPPMWSKLLLIDDLGDLSESTGWRTTEIKVTSGY